MPLNSLFVAFLAFDLAFKDIEDGKGLNITWNNHINDRNPLKGSKTPEIWTSLGKTFPFGL